MAVGEGIVLGVARDDRHRFSKMSQERITLVAGLGVEGDAHAGRTVQHRSRVAAHPDEPNLRQVHLLQSDFADEARRLGHRLGPGDLGENVLTSGVDLLGLPRDTLLHLGPQAVVLVTGLRNPCRQIDHFSAGLLRVAVGRDEAGRVVRRAGVMGVVVAGGAVAVGDSIRVVPPNGRHHRLEPV
jgi:MOSC domain-containing protein YiiM